MEEQEKDKGGGENLAFWGPSNDLPRSFVKKKSVSQTGRGGKNAQSCWTINLQQWTPKKPERDERKKKERTRSSVSW
jgi:hypothetical protein